MSHLDLTQLSLEELQALALEVRDRIEYLEEQSRREAFEKMMELAANVGMSPRELLRMYGDPNASSPAAPVTNKPLYRNPDNPRDTWSGRGRRPGWIVAWENAGKDIKDLLS